MTRQFCTFWLGELFMGIEVEKAQEVLRFRSATEVPLAPRSIRGLINLRGQIVTAVDLRRRANLPDVSEESDPMHIILSEEAGSMSFVVDRVGDVIEVDDEDFEEPPDTLKGDERRLIRGAYKLEDTLLLVLDSKFALDIRNSDRVEERIGD